MLLSPFRRLAVPGSLLSLAEGVSFFRRRSNEIELGMNSRGTSCGSIECGNVRFAKSESYRIEFKVKARLECIIEGILYSLATPAYTAPNRVLL